MGDTLKERPTGFLECSAGFVRGNHGGGGVVCEGPLVGYESVQCACVCKEVCIYSEKSAQAVVSHKLRLQSSASRMSEGVVNAARWRWINYEQEKH